MSLPVVTAGQQRVVRSYQPCQRPFSLRDFLVRFLLEPRENVVKVEFMRPGLRARFQRSGAGPDVEKTIVVRRNTTLHRFAA